MLLSSTVAAASRRSDGDAPRPNFVIIFIDDLGYGDLGCFGSPNIRTPRIDRLAREGVRFTSFYVGAPVCSASRATLLTGRYSARHGTGGVYFPGTGALDLEEVTIAEVLKERGYRTACFGKWHLGDDPGYLPGGQGFDEYWGVPYSNDMYIGPRQKIAGGAVFREGYTRERALADMTFVREHMKDRQAIRQERGLADKVPIISGNEIVEYPADQSTLTRRYFDHALDFVSRADGEPFFLYLTPTMPHIPLFASDQFRGTSRRGLYGDTVEEIDWNVGRLIDFLDTHGLRENTFVLVTSDNGPWLGLGDRSGSAGPLRDGKFTNYEGGVRVPAVARWPGVIPAGAVTSEIVATIDLLPTLAAWSGAPLPAAKIDGIDLGQFLRNPSGTLKRDGFCYLLNGKLVGVRRGPWKYLPHGGGRKIDLDAGPELYHVDHDVSEIDNLIDKFPAEATAMQRLFDRYAREFGQGE